MSLKGNNMSNPSFQFSFSSCFFNFYHSTRSEKKNKRVGVAIGKNIIDLASLKELGYLNELPFSTEDFHNNYLNAMMQHGKFAVRALRDQISLLLDQKNDELQSNKNHCDLVLDNQSIADLHLPIEIGDYTDFYSSEQHAYNVGCMFRDPNNALLPLSLIHI